MMGRRPFSVRAAALLCMAWCMGHRLTSAQAPCEAGDRALAASQWKDAVASYQECLQVNPGFAVYSNMGVAFSHLGQMQDAIASYTRALQLDPSNTRVEFNLAVGLVKAGEYAGAADHLKHLTRTGEDVRYDELLAFSYYHLGSYTLAARAAERVYATHPDDAANALILGSTYTRMRLYDKALPMITFALKAAGSTEGHLILAQTLIGLHQYRDAEVELKSIASTDPDFPGLHEALGELYVGTEQTQAAASEFAAALKQQPNDFEANYFLGRLERFNGHLPAAKRYLDTAGALHPDSPEIAYERGELAMTEHRYAEAIPLLEFAIRGEPDEPQAYLSLAQAYQHNGRREDAQREGELYAAKRRAAYQQEEARAQGSVQKVP